MSPASANKKGEWGKGIQEYKIYDFISLVKWATGPREQALNMICGKREGWGLGAGPMFDFGSHQPFRPVSSCPRRPTVRILGCPVVLDF